MQPTNTKHMTNPQPSHENLHKELDLIQDIIKRMAQNSFQVKAWLIGILSALVVLESKAIFGQTADDHAFSIQMNVFLFLPIICFWYLDAFFLSTERLYRELYKWVVQNRPHTNAYQYDLNTFTRTVGNETTHLLKPKNSRWWLMISKTIWPFYAVPLLFVVGLMLYNFCR